MTTTKSNTRDGIGRHSLLARRYRIGREIARGGMGTVYRVLDEQTGEARALKRLQQPATEDMRAQFAREFRTLSSIRHPRIIEVFDYGVERGEPYYTMELLDGQDLRDLSPLPFVQACRYLRDVATSLALLHTRRLLHRDIKASNVRLTTDGHCKLLDFGALTPFGTPERIVGTPPYLPPEALSRSPLDQRADLYSFGALCYWLLTRRHAYRAREFTDLREAWQQRPASPSKFQPDIPRGMDQLVLSLIDPDPMARPHTMAEVVEMLNRLGSLPPEDDETQDALAESYLATPPFIGRSEPMEMLQAQVAELREGQGSTRLVEAPAGSGRSRLLDELDLHSRLDGVPTVHVDAAMHDRPRGTAIAIVSQLVEKSEPARRSAVMQRAALAPLDPHLAQLLSATGGHEAGSTSQVAQVREAMFHVLTAACDAGPLLVLVDNVDEVDDASLALLGAAAHLAESMPLSLVMTALPGVRSDAQWARFASTLQRTSMPALSEDDTHALSQSIFGNAANLLRFSQWLHGRSGGLPLHWIALVQRLHEDGVIAFRDGVWQLPTEQPDTEIPARLEQLIDNQLDALSPEARALAESVAIRRGLVARNEAGRASMVGGEDPYGVVEELLRRNVLAETVDGYAFRNNALRDAVRARMAEDRRRELHRQCAADVLSGDPGLLTHPNRIEAGRHLLQAGDDDRGADLLAAVAYDTVGVRLSFADLQVVAPALEAALEVYTRQGRGLHERAPLLAALAQAGYYEHRRWADKYADAAIEAYQEMSGMRTAVRLRRYLGKTGALLVGLCAAWWRHMRVPRRMRRYAFPDVLVQLMGLVTTVVGVAASALDTERARKVASVLDPFMHLPKRLTPVGIGEFCYSLCEIGRDNPAGAMATWQRLQTTFADPRYYPTLPLDARPLYLGGLWFARGVFECFRDRGDGLRAADELDGLGLKMYRLVACELRALHHLCRGDLEGAEQHMRALDMHAVEMGSASQVELWEPAARILPYAAQGEMVRLRQVAQQLERLSEHEPPLSRYADLATLALEYVAFSRLDRSDHPSTQDRLIAEASDLLREVPARDFIGWGAVAGHLGRALNTWGRHAEARRACEIVANELTDGDLEYVAMFLPCLTELAVAEAGDGDEAAAAARLDQLLELHAGSDNPLTRGMLHDAYCRVAALAGQWDLHQHHLIEARTYYRATSSPGLAARAELLGRLRRRSVRPTGSEEEPPGETRSRSVADGSLAQTSEVASTKSAEVTREGPRRDR